MGRFYINPNIPEQENLVSLEGTLIGIQHRWTEERVIRVSKDLFARENKNTNSILEISGIPFFCTEQMPPHFQ